MRALTLIVALIGFTAVTAQIVLMRELLVLFGGTEISLGLMLASWLLWTALGSGLLGRIAPRSPRIQTAALEIAVALALPVTILAARAGKAALQTAPAEIFGLGTILLASLAALGPFCLLSGWLFTAVSRLLRGQRDASDSESTSRVYLIEAAGAAAGGILASVILLGRLDSVQISFLLSLLNVLAAAYLLIEPSIARRAVMVLVTAVFAVWLIPSVAPGLERSSVARLWRPFQVVATANSVYGSLVVVGDQDSRTLYENGLPLATVPDPETAEESVDYALLQHPAPENVLLIGGGLNGSLAEALKHPTVRRLDYVELDPEILQLAASLFPDAAERDPRVRVHAADGRLFVKATRESYDVIIVNLPDPQTAQLNRFYTLEFFREARRKLRPGGVFSIRLAFAENYVGPELAALARCIRLTLARAFRDVAFLPGPTLYLFACDSPGRLLTRPAEYVERLHARGLQPTYVREYSIPFRMASDRMEAVEAQLRPRADTPVNHDFAPVAYYFDSVLWSARVDRDTSRWLSRLARLGYGPVLGVVVLAGFLLVLLVRRPAACAAVSVTATGLVMISLQVMLLLGFQAIHGYVYHQLALLIALFMAGMAGGSWLGLRVPERWLWRRLAVVQGSAVAAPLALCLIFEELASAPAIPAFGLLAFLAGLAGGCQFPLASRIYFQDGKARGLGTLYALDLAGSAAGGVLLSAWLIPLFGFWLAALLVSVASLAALLVVRLRAPLAPQR